MARQQKTSQELPNLLLGVTYALNRSNSKRVCIGLEYNEGYFHPVIKFLSAGGSHRTLTFDETEWIHLQNAFDTILEYLHNSYSCHQDPAKTNKIYLPRHTIDFTTSYGVRCIVIEERPAEPAMEESQSFEEQQNDSNCDEPSCKRKKTDTSAIIMQLSTFEGLWNQCRLIDIRYSILKQLMGQINRTIDFVLEYLKAELVKEHGENSKVITSHMKSFKHFYTSHKLGLENFISEKMFEDDYYKEHYLKIVLNEVHAYCLSLIIADVRNYMITVQNNENKKNN